MKNKSADSIVNEYYNDCDFRISSAVFGEYNICYNAGDAWSWFCTVDNYNTALNVIKELKENKDGFYTLPIK